MLRFAVLTGLSMKMLYAPAHAASFDCAKASAPREKVICADPTLSGADTELNDIYVAVSTRLSDEGRTSLRDNQRGWLHFLTEACPIGGSADEPAKAQITSCLF
jgi:uncharacterized protein